jgi:hypothetical protein
MTAILLNVIMNLATFRTTFPEFEIVPDGTIEQRLSWAIAQCDENTWGDLREQGVLLLAAHLVVLTPGGNPLRIEPPKNNPGAPRSLYEAQYRTLLSLVGITRRIANIEQQLNNLRRWR